MALYFEAHINMQEIIIVKILGLSSTHGKLLTENLHFSSEIKVDFK